MLKSFRTWRARSRFERAWQIRDWRAAVEACEALLRDSPDDPKILNNLGNTLLESGDGKRAEIHLRRSNEIQEDCISKNNLGRALLACGQFAEAKAAFLRAIELDGLNLQPRYNLTVCLREEGHVEEAATELRRFVAAFPRHAGSQNDLGCLALDNGETEQALAFFLVSVDIAPEFLPARLNLIRTLTDLRRFPEATPHLQALATAGMRVRVGGTEDAIEIDLNGEPFYRMK